jgi:major vault protein
LANTDKPVIFDEDSKQFERCHLESAVQRFKTAPEGWYITLKNPAEGDKHPGVGAVPIPNLKIGRKVNIRGPVSFPCWPGQMAKVTQGHHLKSNQYAMVRIYDDESARENWDKGVVKGKEGEEEALQIDLESLTMGKLIIIKGTDVSFYIPPTGVEVIKDGDGNLVRDAVTLERLEYCILLDEDGNKRFVKGPDVVFPEPTETFVTKNGARKFKAIELNDQMGLHIKVIADYGGEEEEEHKAGEELFITGQKMRIYYPRPEHAIIKYGDQNVHYAVAIPAGEARYVLNKKTGEIETVKGPKMFLPDPREQVIVRRVLSPKMVDMVYPGNAEAMQHNTDLAAMQRSSAQITESDVMEAAMYLADDAEKPMRRKKALASSFKSEDFSRQTKFTPPRTLTLNTKYDGAVLMSVWTGYAVQITSKTDERRVVVGPASIILDYDESPEIIMFSTGKPKTTDNLFETVYLRVSHNKVSDIIKMETKDLVEVDVKVSYRVNFEGDPKNWFAVENYVKFLCDHLRSMVKNAVKQIGIEEFNRNPISIVRDTILGDQDDSGERSGRKFEENGMKVYDVEVLDVQIRDNRIAALLKDAEQNAVSHWLELEQEKRRLEVDKQLEDIKQEDLRIKAETTALSLKLKQDRIEAESQVDMAAIKQDADREKARLDARVLEQELHDSISNSELARLKAKEEQNISFDKERLELAIKDLDSRVRAWVSKAESIQPGLVEAIQGLSDKDLLAKLSENMAPLAILGGSSISDVINKLLKGTKLDGVLSENGKKLAETVRAAIGSGQDRFGNED